MIGEVTPEVKAFLESMGRKVRTPEEEIMEWKATHEVGRPKRVSRRHVHDPPAWGPLMPDRWPEIIPASRVKFLRQEVFEEFEVGSRVTSSYFVQRDFISYISCLPAHVSQQTNNNDQEAA